MPGQLLMHIFELASVADFGKLDPLHVDMLERPKTSQV